MSRALRAPFARADNHEVVSMTTDWGSVDAGGLNSKKGILRRLSGAGPSA